MTVWDEATPIVKNKISTKPKRINQMIFAEDGNLLTAGEQHLNLWNFSTGLSVKVAANISAFTEKKNITLSKDLVDK